MADWKTGDELDPIGDLQAWVGGAAEAEGEPDLSYIIEDLRPLAVPIDSISQDPANLRQHGPENISAIVGSLRRFGQRKPVVVNRNTHCIEAGNGTWEAAKKLGWSHVAAVFVEDDPTTATGYAIADNRTAELAAWDYVSLDKVLAAWMDQDKELLDGTGWTFEDLEKIAELAGRELEEKEAGTGDLLEHVEVTIDDPKREVSTGDVWRVGDHVLIVVDVFSQWHIWVEYLHGEGVLFVPYPGPFVPLTLKADDHALVMVQPDPFIAGHLLDQYSNIFGAESVELLEQVDLAEAFEDD